MEKLKYFIFGVIFISILFMFISAADDQPQNNKDRYQIEALPNQGGFDKLFILDKYTGIVKEVYKPYGTTPTPKHQLGRTFEEMSTTIH